MKTLELGQFALEIPGNGIAQAGIDAIQQLLCNWGFGRIPSVIPRPEGSTTPWSWEWKVGGKGEYVGTLPKRISKVIWQATKCKLTPEQLSEIGNIGAAHAGKHAMYYYDIVDCIDWDQTDFGQPSDCCFWGGRASAKDMIIDNGGLAIRFFRDDNYEVEDGYARAWLAPWGNHCWIVFNGYGLETLAIARILAAHLNHAYYRKVRLCNNNDTSGTLWLNSGAGWLVGPQEEVLKWTRIDLEWEELDSLRTCVHCGESIDEDDLYYDPNDEDICESCYNDNCFRCERCQQNSWYDKSKETPDKELLCQCCWEEECIECENCGIVVWLKDAICNSCHYEVYTSCCKCGEDIPLDTALIDYKDDTYCMDCYIKEMKGYVEKIKTSRSEAPEIAVEAPEAPMAVETPIDPEAVTEAPGAVEMPT